MWRGAGISNGIRLKLLRNRAKEPLFSPKELSQTQLTVSFVITALRFNRKRQTIKDCTTLRSYIDQQNHPFLNDLLGCDGSVLLDGSASTPSEKDAIPNLTLTPEAFETINDLRDRVQKACGQIVSCTDIVALAARDSVYLSGGPDYRVPLGRRDGLTFATPDTTLANLPSPFSNVSLLLAGFAIKKLNATDLVALSGGHTIGIGHCPTFTPRLYPTQDPTMDKTFAKNLYATCPAANTNNSTVLDIRSPNVFDNKYFVDLMNRQGLFTSDQDLYTDKRTREIVLEYAVNQTVFFEQFALSMVRMSQLSVLTGNSGQIRGNCSARNSGGTYLSSLVDTAVGDLVF